MFPQVCTVESSFLNTTSGMHRRPIEGQHLVEIKFVFFFKDFFGGCDGGMVFSSHSVPSGVLVSQMEFLHAHFNTRLVFVWISIL